MPRQVFFNFRSLPNFSITFGVLLDSAPSIAVCCLSQRGPHTTEWAPLSPLFSLLSPSLPPLLLLLLLLFVSLLFSGSVTNVAKTQNCPFLEGFPVSGVE